MNNYKSSTVAFSASCIIAIVAEANAAEAAHKGPYVPETHTARKVRREVAFAALRAVFAGVGWGANGNTFISNRKVNWDGDRMQRLYVQNRLVAVCLNGRWAELIGPAESKRMHAEAEHIGREQQQTLMADRAALIQDLVDARITSPRSFGKWVFYDGQKGGSFHRKENDGHGSVAAPGVMKAVKELLASAETQKEVFEERYGALQEKLSRPASRRRGHEQAYEAYAD